MVLTFDDFEKALESLEIVSKASLLDIKNKYKELSKRYHPDMPNGDKEKFLEIKNAYKIVQIYMTSFRFKLNEEEFYEQNPSFKREGDWFYNF